MNINVWTLVGLLAEHGGALMWAVLKGLLLWGSLSLVVVLTLYFLCARLGALDPRGQRKRATRVIFDLALLLGAWPLATGAGVVHELRNATVRSMRTETRKTQVHRTVGGVLVAPAVLAHLVAEGRYGSAQATAPSISSRAKVSTIRSMAPFLNEGSSMEEIQLAAVMTESSTSPIDANKMIYATSGSRSGGSGGVMSGNTIIVGIVVASTLALAVNGFDSTSNH